MQGLDEPLPDIRGVLSRRPSPTLSDNRYQQRITYSRYLNDPVMASLRLFSLEQRATAWKAPSV